MSVTVNKTRLPGSVIKTASGAVASISDARMRGAIGVEASFSPKQDLHGYSYPWVGGAGKNMINRSSPIVDSRTAYYREFGSASQQINEVHLVVGTTYTLSFDIQCDNEPFMISAGAGSGSYQRDILQIRNLVSGRVSITFTPTEVNLAMGDIFAFRAPRYPSQQTFNMTITNIQLELGSTATAWTPYENLCPISGITEASAFVSQQYPDANPRSVTAQLGEERYGGSYDFVRGELTLTMRMVDLGSLSWRTYSASYGKCYYATPSGGKNRFAGVCSSYRQNQVSYLNLANGEFCTNSGAGYSMLVRDDRYPNATGSDFKSAVSGVQLCYELATPIVIDMTPAEFELFHRQNYVWSDVGDTTLTYAAIHEHGG